MNEERKHRYKMLKAQNISLLVVTTVRRGLSFGQPFTRLRICNTITLATLSYTTESNSGLHPLHRGKEWQLEIIWKLKIAGSREC
jgi:hypothetical protein